jgi:hypothetical protein
MSDRVAIIGGMREGIPPGLLELARAQAGVVSRRQAIGSGMSGSAVRSKVASGRWQRIHPGVYALFTGDIGHNAHLWAALLYGGRGAQLSHETAAELLRLTDKKSAFIHLKIPADREVRPPKGVVIHRSCHMDHRWRFPRGVPPHTLVEETLLDLLETTVNFDDAVGWITRALQRKLTSEERLRQAVAGRKKLRWRDRLDELMATAASGTHSPLEYRYDRDVERAHGLPQASKQAPFTKPDGTRGFRDRHYAEHRLVVELDGKEFHDEEHRNHDRRRDNAATATTGSTLRYGWRDVTRTPCETAAEVYVALRKRGYSGTLKACSATCTALAHLARYTRDAGVGTRGQTR